MAQIILKLVNSNELVQVTCYVPEHVKEFDYISHFNELAIVYSIERI